MVPKPVVAGFWSYVHLDDEHENGRITRLRERLERSIRFYSGHRDFRIFVDRRDIGWGERWAQVIAGSLDHALLLFPVITPSYFSSRPCREEALAFQKRQAKLGRDDLILPIYYVNADLMAGADKATPEPEEQEVTALLRAHQYEDWRQLRETSETDPAYGKAVERLAQKAVEALKRSRATDGGDGPQGQAPAGTAAPEEPQQEENGSTPAAEAVPEPTSAHLSTAVESTPGHIITLTVNQMPGRAQFVTITDAIARAPGGARILISPGYYRESVIIDKPLELIGDGPLDDIIIEADGPEALIFDTNIGVVRNLTLRQRQSEPADYCVWVKQGRLDLEDCDLSSTGLASLAVMNNADPRVRRNRIHDGKAGGIFVYDRGRGTYEDNEVFGNAETGIEVADGAEPVVRRNRIHDGKAGGISVSRQGRGTYEDNEVFGNASVGMYVSDGAEPVVRRSRIYDNGASGIYVYDQGRGTYEDNEIFDNKRAGISVSDGAEPVVRRNQIHDGRQSGIHVYNQGRGTYEDNEVFGNVKTGIIVTSGSEPVVRRNRIHDGRQSGIHVYDQGRGTYDDNEVFSNAGTGISVGNGGNPTVRRNRITGNRYAGVRISEGGAGVFEDNDVRENPRQPWDIHPSAEAQVKRTRNREK
jgi:F-box protein 11